MSKFEFVSFNEDIHDDAVCFGNLVFKYDGQTYKTLPWVINPHNTLDTCTVKAWIDEDIAWSRVQADISDEDKPLFLKMIADDVTPIVSKCRMCFSPGCTFGGVRMNDEHTSALV